MIRFQILSHFLFSLGTLLAHKMYIIPYSINERIPLFRCPGVKPL